MKTNWRN